MRAQKSNSLANHGQAAQNNKRSSLTNDGPLAQVKLGKRFTSKQNIVEASEEGDAQA